MSRLIHVKKIEMAGEGDPLPVKITSETSCLFTGEVYFSPVELHELVGVEVEDAYENNQRIYTTTATFTTSCKKPLAGRRAAFRLTSISGERYLIGTGSRPFPVIKEKNPFPRKPADTTLKTVTITWRSTLPMLLIAE